MMMRYLLVVWGLAWIGSQTPALEAQQTRTEGGTSASASPSPEFDRLYPEAAALLNAFDAGHALLYERLFTEPGASIARIEEETYGELVGRIRGGSDREPVALLTTMPRFAAFAPRLAETLAWAHNFHRQIYEIYADDRIADKGSAVAEAVERYRSRTDFALPAEPKSMNVMYHYPFSTSFRRGYPSTHRLVWASHWLQLALYEPLLLSRTLEQRRAGIDTTVTRFHAKLDNAPAGLPVEMPTPPAIAPELVRLHPEVAAIFDNLHMLHDVVADILTDGSIPDHRAAIDEALVNVTDPQFLAATEYNWIVMSLRHGIYNQGGPALGLLTRSERNRDPSHGDHASHTGAAMLPGMGSLDPNVPSGGAPVGPGNHEGH